MWPSLLIRKGLVLSNLEKLHLATASEERSLNVTLWMRLFGFAGQPCILQPIGGPRPLDPQRDLVSDEPDMRNLAKKALYSFMACIDGFIARLKRYDGEYTTRCLNIKSPTWWRQVSSISSETFWVVWGYLKYSERGLGGIRLPLLRFRTQPRFPQRSAWASRYVRAARYQYLHPQNEMLQSCGPNAGRS